MSNYDLALRDAVDRDLRDAERLDHIQTLVTNLLDALVPEMETGALEHPDSRWHPDDLVTDLMGHLKSIHWEQQRVSRGPIVLGDA